MKKNKLQADKLNEITRNLEENGIKYDTKFCDSAHCYLIHCWINEKYKCNLFAKSFRWTPFGYHKGISGQGLDELKHYLINAEKILSKKEYSYKEKFEAMRDTLLQVRNETNFDIIDSVLNEYS